MKQAFICSYNKTARGSISAENTVGFNKNCACYCKLRTPWWTVDDNWMFIPEWSPCNLHNRLSAAGVDIDLVKRTRSDNLDGIPPLKSLCVVIRWLSASVFPAFRSSVDVKRVNSEAPKRRRWPRCAIRKTYIPVYLYIPIKIRAIWEIVAIWSVRDGSFLLHWSRRLLSSSARKGNLLDFLKKQHRPRPFQTPRTAWR